MSSERASSFRGGRLGRKRVGPSRPENGRAAGRRRRHLAGRVLRWLRVRGVRDLRDLDTRGRLGHPPRPLALATAVFVLVALLGLATFALGHTHGTNELLLAAAVAVFAIAVSVGWALAIAQYRALEEADQARAELLTLHTARDLARRETAARLHDARSLGAAMGAALHALRQSGADASIVDALSDQLSQMRDLLAAAPDPHPQPLALGEVLARAGSFAALHGVAFIHEAADEAVVLADRDRVLAILKNLIDNARKYAPGSPILVSCEPAGPYLKIVVEDRGPGIALAEMEALFLPGVRRGGDGQGSGMGLAIARDLAESMRGALWYEPTSGTGSRFVLKLPRPPVPVEAPQDMP
jgi:signal transduction histidine kinase